MKIWAYIFLGLCACTLFSIIVIGGYSYAIRSSVCALNDGLSSCVFKLTDPAAYGYLVSQPYSVRLVFGGVTLVLSACILSYVAQLLGAGLGFASRKLIGR